MKTVIVKTQRKTYPVIIGNNILLQLRKKIDKLNSPDLFIVIDENVSKYHLSSIKNVFNNWKGKLEYFLLPAGEKTKSFFWFRQIHTSLLKSYFGKDTVLVSVGGGVTGDIAGFAASTFMRGIKLVHIPTTLLACVDSSIGGKTSINLNHRKNMVGTFYQPEFVFIDTRFFKTLPKREFTSAVGEIIKYAFISNKKFYDYVIANLDGNTLLETDVLQYMIKECVSIKGAIVSQDELEEKGIRKILNLGHTFAHSIEGSLNYKIKHGEAVAAGITSSLFLSNIIGLIDDERLKKFLALTSKIKLPKSILKLSENDAVKIMQSDKKVRNNILLFVLIKDVGKIAVDVPAEKTAIKQSLKLMKKFYFV